MFFYIDFLCCGNRESSFLLYGGGLLPPSVRLMPNGTAITLRTNPLYGRTHVCVPF